MRRLVTLFVLLALVAIGAVAQDTVEPAESDGFLLNLLENRLSTPDRQIRLSGVTGALSSRARIDRVTISDQTGVWLEIRGVELDWSRLALLRGRVNVNRLSAQQINWLRRAVPAPKPVVRQPETSAPFQLPELPVSINVSALSLPDITFNQAVFGQAAQLSLEGALSLARGTLDTNLDVTRLDQPGGNFTLDASFSNASRQISVDLELHEPAGGLLASLLRVEGRPALDLSVQGSGPLDRVDFTFTLDANRARMANGLVALTTTDAGLGFDARFDGELAPLIPEQFRDFFAGDSRVAASGTSLAGGGLRIDAMSVAGAVLDLEGGLQTGADGFLRDLTLSGRLGDPQGAPVLLPVPGGRTSLQSAVLHVNYGDASRWDGLVVLDRLAAADILMEDVTLKLGGLAQNLDDPARRNVTINVEGLATGVSHADPDIDRALGDRIDLFADAALPPTGPIAIKQLQLSGNGLSVFSAGTLENMVYTGRNAARVADLAIFAGIAGRPLGGAIDVKANGSISPRTGGFDLTFDGGTTDLVLGDDRLDALLAGATTLAGRAVRDATGFRTENLSVENPQLSFASNGALSSTKTDIGFTARLADLGLIDPRASGALEAEGRATGDGRPIAVTLTAQVPTGRVLDRPLTNVALGFQGSVDSASALTGSLTGSGGLDGLVLDLAGDVAVAGDRRSVDGLTVAVGPNRLTGNLAQAGTAPATGRLTLDAPDIAPVAALALVEATGAVSADITLAGTDAGQQASIKASASAIAVGPTRIGALSTDADVSIAGGVPLVTGTLSASNAVVSGIEIASLSANASQATADAMTVSANARLAIGTLVDLGGELTRLDNGFAATLSSLNLRQQGTSATLRAPATATIAGGTVTLTPLGLDVGGGSITAQGSVGDSLDLDLAIRALPLGLANTVRPDLALAGTINGTARVTGPRDAPDVRFDLNAGGIESGITRGAGLPPLAVTATGTTAGNRLNLQANASSTNGLSARVSGSAPLNAGGALDLTVDLGSFPLALVDRLAGQRGLRGTVTGQGRVTGPLTDPAATFNLDANGLSANVMQEFGLPALGLTAAGSYGGQSLTLTSARLTGGGADLTASGRIPFTGPGLDLRAAGTLPLALANPFLAERSAQVAGELRLNASMQGALTAPQFGGTVALAGGTLVYPDLNIRLNDIAVDARLNGTTATLERLTAAVATGGSIAASGTVDLNSARGYPADLRGRLDRVRYTDGQFVTTTIDGALTMNGPLVGGEGLLAGRIDLGTTEISIAEGLGASQAVLEQVVHVDTPPAVQQTLDRARIGTEPSQRQPSGPGIRLDVEVNAPNQIFVRGRGLDVELGGRLRVQGRTTDIQPVGQFDLRRGRLNILGQRIDFDSGSLQLVGNLDPEIHLVAQTQSEDVTAIVTVGGRVSSPQVTFSSEPPLPQDEVLARVLFNRSTQNLSAFQVAQLAAAAAELAGGGGPGILSQLRGATGLDDLDIITEEDGSTAVRAGKYISDNVYVNLQTDTDGVTSAEINLDLTRSVTARGSVDSDGNSTIGVFYQRDY